MQDGWELWEGGIVDEKMYGAPCTEYLLTTTSCTVANPTTVAVLVSGEVRQRVRRVRSTGVEGLGRERLSVPARGLSTRLGIGVTWGIG